MSDDKFFPGQDEIQDARRAGAARQSYIVWRMQDLPSVYTDLLPFTPDLAELWEAEKALRRQYAEDQKLAASPWRIIGPRSNLVDRANMTSQDLVAFGFETSLEFGLPGVVKDGFENHPDVQAVRAKAQDSELYKLTVERGQLIELLGTRSLRPGRERLTGEAAEAAQKRVEEIEARLREIQGK